MQLLCGEHNRHLARIEQAVGVSLDSFGNIIQITGNRDNADAARETLENLYQQIANDSSASVAVATSMIDDAVRWAGGGAAPPASHGGGSTTVQTWRKPIQAKTPGQQAYLKAIAGHDVTIGIGPAGSGKTYLAVAKAVEALKTREVERLILSRPAVEAGERLGFLPGDMKEKVDPYLRPLYDALHDMMPADKVEKMMAAGQIEIAPLAFMRGRTLSQAFVIIDEAQNTTPVQMKMVLTRLGDHSRMVITGDITQVDLPAGQISGLKDAVGLLDGVKGVAIATMAGQDVVRHPVVARILQAYENRATQQRGQ